MKTISADRHRGTIKRPTAQPLATDSADQVGGSVPVPRERGRKVTQGAVARAGDVDPAVAAAVVATRRDARSASSASTA